MKPNEIRQIFDYNYWAFERVWDCISQLSDEQFIEEIDYSTGSIRNLVAHLMGSSRNWISRLAGTEMPPRLVFEDFGSLSETKAKWDERRKELLDYLDSLTREQIDEAVDWELPAIRLKSTNSRGEILLHLANHGTDHRAQILAILHHHFHVKTVEQDMIYYLAEQNNSG